MERSTIQVERHRASKAVSRIIVVIKVGTSSLLRPENGPSLNLSMLARLAETVKKLHNKGCSVILVSSGAVGVGCMLMGVETPPHQRSKRQALAALGQAHLMKYYEEFLGAMGLNCAQVLLTKSSISSKEQWQATRSSLLEMVSYGMVPVLNENDTMPAGPALAKVIPSDCDCIQLDLKPSAAEAETTEQELLDAAAATTTTTSTSAALTAAATDSVFASAQCSATAGAAGAGAKVASDGAACIRSSTTSLQFLCLSPAKASNIAASHTSSHIAGQMARSHSLVTLSQLPILNLSQQPADVEFRRQGLSSGVTQGPHPSPRSHHKRSFSSGLYGADTSLGTLSLARCHTLLNLSHTSMTIPAYKCDQQGPAGVMAVAPEPLHLGSSLAGVRARGSLGSWSPGLLDHLCRVEAEEAGSPTFYPPSKALKSSGGHAAPAPASTGAYTSSTGIQVASGRISPEIRSDVADLTTRGGVLATSACVPVQMTSVTPTAAASAAITTVQPPSKAAPAASSSASIGDNDTLAAYVAALVQADWLFLLTDVECLYTANPKEDPAARPIQVVTDVSQLEADTSSRGTQWGTGGMATKLAAARLATTAGCAMVICHSNKPEAISEVVDAKRHRGTIFLPLHSVRTPKLWLLGAPVTASLWLTPAAVKALREKRRAIMSMAIAKVEGSFHINEPVVLRDSQGQQIGRGVANVCSLMLEALLKVRSLCLGQRGAGQGLSALSGDVWDRVANWQTREVVHRENVLLMVPALPTAHIHGTLQSGTAQSS